MIGTILVVILVLILLGGVGPWSPGGYGYGYGHGGIGGLLGLVLVVILIHVPTWWEALMALVILAFAFVFAILAAAAWPAVNRPRLGWLALALFILYFIVTGAGPLFSIAG